MNPTEQQRPVGLHVYGKIKPLGYVLIFHAFHEGFFFKQGPIS